MDAFSFSNSLALTQEKFTCRVCAESLPRESFYADRSKKHGIRTVCKVCDKAMVLKWQRENVDKVRAKNSAWGKSNPESSHRRNKRWRETHQEFNRIRKQEWILKNPEKQSEYNAKARSTPKGVVSDSVRRSINNSIRSGSKLGSKTFDILGYSQLELVAHLESKFTDGMTWANYGKHGWHIDHIIPLSVHNYETPRDIDFKKAWALENLQPLWAIENWKKHDKISKPFQPSFAI